MPYALRTVLSGALALALSLSAVAAVPSPAPTPSPQQLAMLQKLEAKLSPSARAKLTPLIARVRSQANGTVPGDPVSTTNSTLPGLFAGASQGDIEAIAFIVMMEASKSANDDLKSVMDQVKANDAQKQQQRALLAAMPHVSPAAPAARTSGTTTSQNASVATNASIPANSTMQSSHPGSVNVATRTSADSAKNSLDSMSDMSEMTSLRLQMAMDRMSKMMSTLSNLMKKLSDTSDAVIQNMK